MTIHEYLETKQITYRELEEHFTLERKIDIDTVHWNNQGCWNCQNKMNSSEFPASPWSRVRSCGACKRIMIAFISDRMGGNHTDTVEVYMEKPNAATAGMNMMEGSPQPEQEKITGLNFGDAIRFLKRGKCVQRAGWNGKGMHLWLNKGSYAFRSEGQPHSDVNEGDLIEGIQERLFENGDEGTITRLPNINMKSASGSTVTGWLASQTDMLAEDWQVVE